jgi:Cys-rich protein (TIGR01571 family)
MLRLDSNASGNPSQPRYNVQGHVLPPPSAALLGSDWVSGLCDCLDDCSSAMDIFFCSWCQLGYQYHRLRKWYIDMDAAVCCGAWCLDLVGAGLGSFIMTTYLRSKIAERYGIEEHFCKSCLIGFFCGCCSQCQQHRELAARGEYCGGVCISKPCVTQPPPMVGMGGMMNVMHASSPAAMAMQPQRQHQPRHLPSGAVYAVPCQEAQPRLGAAGAQPTSSSDYPPTPMAPMMPPTPMQPNTPGGVVTGQVLPPPGAGYTEHYQQPAGDAVFLQQQHSDSAFSPTSGAQAKPDPTSPAVAVVDERNV